MSIRDIPRGAVDGAVKLARLPVDAAIALLPGNGNGARPAATIAVDRVDATVRKVAGYALRDEELREDAMRRRVAADERARALRLRDTAEARSAAADEKLADRVEQAEERRAAAEQRAKRERAQAEQRRAAKSRAAGQAETKRKASSRRAKAKVDEVIDEQADEARLAQLKTEAKALEKREAALIAKDEARRLQDAATARKAARKKR